MMVRSVDAGVGTDFQAGADGKAKPGRSQAKPGRSQAKPGRSHRQDEHTFQADAGGSRAARLANAVLGNVEKNGGIELDGEAEMSTHVDKG